MILRCCRRLSGPVFWRVVSSYAGILVIGLSAQGEICLVSFLANNSPASVLEKWQNKWPETVFSASPERKSFGAYSHHPVLLAGTEFQCRVWRAIEKIPFGQTRTYGFIAQQIGAPKAVRAVGMACGANPAPLFIPCHRVVAQKGLGGFSAGTGIKKRLLEKETVAPNKKGPKNTTEAV